MIHAEAPLETVPLYVRGGAIIPMGPEMNYVGEKAADPLTFEIYPDAKGNARTSLYEDDGVSPAYRNGVERRTNVTYQSSHARAEIDVSAPTGSYQPGARNLLFAIHPAPRASKPVQFADHGRPYHIQLH
jgi:alpha-glucosidase (family GH31 glycosyl hydrolase)